MNRLEAVAVCVDYADYLAETLPFLLPHVDDVVVVTSPDDGRTHRICKQHGVRFLPTRCFYRDGEPFNKARGINYGLANLKLDGWVLHIDADTVLPPRTRYLLEQHGPRSSQALRRATASIAWAATAWDDLKASPEIQYEWNCLVKPPRRWALGARIAHMEYGGYCPIGFFQLWHPSGSGVSAISPRRPGRRPSTPTCSTPSSGIGRTACLIPELICIHLETKDKGDRRPMGQNWAGRTTPEFTRDESPYRGASTRPSESGPRAQRLFVRRNVDRSQYAVEPSFRPA